MVNLLTGEWTLYRGTLGKVEWGETSKDSYEGLSSHFLTVTELPAEGNDGTAFPALTPPLWRHVGKHELRAETNL